MKYLFEKGQVRGGVCTSTFLSQSLQYRQFPPLVEVNSSWGTASAAFLIVDGSVTLDSGDTSDDSPGAVILPGSIVGGGHLLAGIESERVLAGEAGCTVVVITIETLRTMTTAIHTPSNNLAGEDVAGFFKCRARWEGLLLIPRRCEQVDVPHCPQVCKARLDPALAASRRGVCHS